MTYLLFRLRPADAERRSTTQAATSIPLGVGRMAWLALLIAAGAGYALWPATQVHAATSAQSPESTARVRVNAKDGLRYVYIPAGKFRMGCSEGDSFCGLNEKPAHNVQISKGFWIGQTEVTQAAYKKVMNAAPSNFHGDTHPVEQVSWEDASRYCAAVNLRLPTEAEWEYAARAGSRESRYGKLDQIAWYRENSLRPKPVNPKKASPWALQRVLADAWEWIADRYDESEERRRGKRDRLAFFNDFSSSRPVASKAPNAWELYDMLGNVWEWTADRYDENYYQHSPNSDPQGPGAGGHRILRGGDWMSAPWNVRVSIRAWSEPSVWVSYNGFRCAGDLP